MQRYLFSIFIALVFFSSGCGFFYPEESPRSPALSGTKDENPSTSEVAVKPLRLKDGSEFTDIEITLQAPDVPVDGFVIRYGRSLTVLDQIKRVGIEELEKAPGEHQYKYRLKAIHDQEKLYLSVASYRGDTVSEPSAPIEVK